MNSEYDEQLFFSGWLYGAFHGKTGLFPADAVVSVTLRKLAPSQNEPISSTSAPSESVASAAVSNLYVVFVESGSLTRDFCKRIDMAV
jgi:hypothetical protein